jgi:hypothetical protein
MIKWYGNINPNAEIRLIFYKEENMSLRLTETPLSPDAE